MNPDNLNQSQLAQGLTWLPHAGADIASADTGSWPQSAALVQLISAAEQQTATDLPAGDEKDHYCRRKLFQRMFVAKLLGFQRPLAELPLVQARDRRPVCALQPHLCLSFSSAGNLLMAAAAQERTIGIDVERLRPVTDAASLAQRFFAVSEAEVLQELPQKERETAFIRLWSAKEACLKALGTGVVAGAELFQFSLTGHTLQMRAGPPEWQQQDWSLQELPAPEGYIAYLAGFSTG